MATKADKACEAYLAALSAKEKAEQACETARELLISAFADEGINEQECGELRVALSHRSRRSFAVEKLRKVVSPAVFRRLTKSSVDTKAWDSALEKGEIPAKVIKAVVTETEYVAVLVTPAKGAEKPVSKKQSVA